MPLELVDSPTDLARALAKRRQAAAALECPSRWLLEGPSVGPVVDLARRIAKVPTMPIIIQGEVGCGVQELARLVHDADPVARDGRFRSMNAQFVTPVEMRGSIRHGTLFLQGLESLRPPGQTWLLEALSERESGTRKLRIIVSSRVSVGELLRAGQLVGELIHTLDVSRLTIPPLRERPGEILLQARRMLAHYARVQGRPGLRFDSAAESKLLRHTYPGNLSELRNVVERAVALAASDTDVIGDSAIAFYEGGRSDDQPRRVPAVEARKGPDPARLPSMQEVEKDYLVMLIRECRGRRTAMARAMGVSYPTVLKKIAHHQLDVRAIAASAWTGVAHDDA